MTVVLARVAPPTVAATMARLRYLRHGLRAGFGGPRDGDGLGVDDGVHQAGAAAMALAHWQKLFLAFATVMAFEASAEVANAQPCTFVFGFAAIHDLIPDVVGDCLDDEFYQPQTGDALQHSTNGLLVWRKADNWTAFTDGFESWVYGPLGLQQRPNEQRLWWEANTDNLPIVPPPQPGDRCHTAGLALSVVGVDAGAGNFVGTFRFSNTQDVDCTFFGYPGAQLLDDASNPVPTTVERGGGYFTNDPPPGLLDVAPHGSAIFRIHWEQVPVGNETTCSMASRLAVTPPDEYVALSVPIQIRACGGGHLNMSAVRSDASVVQ